MTPLAAIQAGTIRGAELLGLAGSRGAIEAGKVADIVAVDGDPLTDVRALEHVRFVMHAGSIVIDRPRPR